MQPRRIIVVSTIQPTTRTVDKPVAVACEPRYPSSSASSRRRFVLPFLLVLLLSSSICGSDAWPSAPNADIIWNATGVMPAGTYFQHLDLLPAGWTRQSLCGGNVDDCSFQLELKQLDPDPRASDCSLGAVLQINCASQTTAQSFAKMVCVSPGPGSTSPDSSVVLFPQDSPNMSFNQTIWSGPEVNSNMGGDPALTWVHNPIHGMLSPSLFETMERVALRNLRNSTSPSTTPTSLFRSGVLQQAQTGDSSALPVRVLVLNMRKDTCGSDISYFASVRVVHNSGCQSITVYPGYRVVIPGSNTTNSTTVWVSGYNITSNVSCASTHGSCLSFAPDHSMPLDGNVTSRCHCDGGWTSFDGVKGDCGKDLGVDLTLVGPSIRPFDPDFNNSDPGTMWIAPNAQNVRGQVLHLTAVNLNTTVASERRGPSKQYDAVGNSTPALLSSYWYARLNLSRALADLTHVVHINILPGQNFDDVAPMQFQFSPDAYPALDVNTPLSCLNGSDLQTNGPVASGSTSWRRAGEFHLAEPYTSSSCWMLFQPYPDLVTPYASKQAFKIVLHPAFVAGFLDRAGSNAPNTTVYLSLYFQQQLYVDVRVWVQEDLGIFLPTPNRARTAPNSGSLTNSRRTSRSLPSSSRVSRPLVSSSWKDVPIAYQNQSWVQSLLENEMVFFHLNHTWWQLPNEAEQASLYIQINDTACVSGVMAEGWTPPHWWGGLSPSGASLLPGESISGFPAWVPPPAQGAPPVQALAGGCLRPGDRTRLTTPTDGAGWFGMLMSVCTTWLELSVWHVPPLTLDTKQHINVWAEGALNTTGSNCWRELTLDIVTSAAVQNDLLITIDQIDARILMMMQPLPAPPLPVYPTVESHYNTTSQEMVPNTDGSGSPEGWQQARIAYADLQVNQRWYVAVYFDPSPGDQGLPHPARSFRVLLQWATDQSFQHMSTTLKILLGCGGGLVAILIAVALKMRIDACRRARDANKRRSAAAKNVEKIRLMQQGKATDYTRMG